MAFNPFFGCSRDKLEAWHDQAMEEAATGKILTSWGASDASGGSTLAAGLTVEKRLEYLKAELNRQFPDDYPNTGNRRVKRTQVQVNQSGSNFPS